MERINPQDLKTFERIILSNLMILENNTASEWEYLRRAWNRSPQFTVEGLSRIFAMCSQRPKGRVNRAVKSYYDSFTRKYPTDVKLPKGFCNELIEAVKVTIEARWGERAYRVSDIHSQVRIAFLADGANERLKYYG